MGRELRRVSKDWQHPMINGKYKPVYDEGYGHAISEWVENHQLWLQGKHPDQLEDPEGLAEYKYYAEWDGNPPDIESYRPDWSDDEMTQYVLYENVSEGTPITPAFDTKEELVAYLVENGDFWGNNWTLKQAQAMVEREYAPSFVISGGKLYNAQESTEL